MTLGELWVVMALPDDETPADGWASACDVADQLAMPLGEVLAELGGLMEHVPPLVVCAPDGRGWARTRWGTAAVAREFDGVAAMPTAEAA